MQNDIIIIGAGAAGLAAAAELAAHKRQTLVLEARDRIGGRCWSRYEPGLSVPIEMGAEFIHGRPAVTLSLLQQSGIEAIERTGNRWFLQSGKIRPRARDEIMTRILQAMKQAGAPRPDVSFRVYLDNDLRDRLAPAERTVALRTVEGYDAADPQLVSARAIVEEWTREDRGNDANYRPRGGYGALMSALASRLTGSAVRLQLQSIVRSVQWSRGRVVVEGTVLGKPFREHAARVIVTLPLGVLQLAPGVAGAVRFAPALQQKERALDGLLSGPVARLALRFRTAFWEQVDAGRYRDTGFLQSAEAAFPTFWTMLPMRAPLLIAWAGGPRALRMAGMDTPAKIQQAVASLQRFFSAGVDVESQLEAAWLHDWQADPFACGAYSSVKVGGRQARKALAAPLENTLHFAGEATDCEGEAGTVAGALQSGMRAAREVIL
jgi:monoamine oxidase